MSIRRFLPRESWRGWIFNPYWADNCTTCVLLTIGFWFLIVGAACALAGAILFGCSGQQRVITDAEYFACNQEGLAIIADQSLTCPQVLAGLDKLVAEKPECQQVFKGDRTGMSCEVEGGQQHGSR